uniref:Uncharacterized protein n=1 Tax=Opuntia streptacantha TaxID=393608 RepID=A0A7C8ZWR9_OPUST
MSLYKSPVVDSRSSMTDIRPCHSIIGMAPQVFNGGPTPSTLLLLFFLFCVVSLLNLGLSQCSFTSFMLPGEMRSDIFPIPEVSPTCDTSGILILGFWACIWVWSKNEKLKRGSYWRFGTNDMVFSC